MARRRRADAKAAHPPEECHPARPIRISQNETVHIRSRAGLETCCYLEGLDLAFDMGCLFGRVKMKSNVFISHGHMDHIGALAQHAARRKLHHLPVANYYVPEALVSRVESLLHSFSLLHEDTIPFRIVPVSAGKKITLKGHRIISVVPFRTVHRVESVGYLVYKHARHLKAEYQALAGPELGRLKKRGVDIYDEESTPDIAYTGDTSIEVFDLNPILFDVRVLITEMTFVNDSVTTKRAHDTGHIHLDEFMRIISKFKAEVIIFMHISARFSKKDIQVALDAHRCCPSEIRRKIHVAL